MFLPPCLLSGGGSSCPVLRGGAENPFVHTIGSTFLRYFCGIRSSYDLGFAGGGKC